MKTLKAEKHARKIQAVRFRRAVNAIHLKRKRLRKKPPRQRMPVKIELEQKQKLRKMLEHLRSLVKEILLPALPRFVREDAFEFARFDATADELEKIIGGIKLRFGQQYPASKIKKMATEYAKDLNYYNGAEMDRVFQSVLGIDAATIPSLAEHLDLFIKENVRLISSLSDDALDQIEGIVSRGARSGARAEAMSEQIMQRVDVSESRANLIARDQANKLYGDLTQLRQTETGVTRYTWRTSLDERVREEHQLLEGTEQSWDDPPPPGHPGQDYQCRCTAEPIISDVLDALESQGGDLVP